jgi:hypothetical protein
MDFLQIQWIGALVIGLYFACIAFILFSKRSEVAAITASPEGREVDFTKIRSVD